MRIARGTIQDIQDRLKPRATDPGRIIFFFDVRQMDGGPAQVKEHQNEEGNVADLNGEIQQVDKLLAILYLQYIVRKVNHGLAFRDEFRKSEALENVLVVEIDVDLFRLDELDQFVTLHGKEEIG